MNASNHWLPLAAAFLLFAASPPDTNTPPTPISGRARS
jgi:hypothetical protein